MKRLVLFCMLMCTMIIPLCSCASTPDVMDNNEMSIAAPVQTQTVPTESDSSPSTDNMDPLSIDEYNISCVKKENGKAIETVCSIDNNYILSINAVVDVGDVEKVGLYQYIPVSISDAQRNALFSAYFGDRVDEVIHNTTGWANQWYLETEHEYYEFGYSQGMNLIYEETFFLRDFKTLIEESDNNMLNSLAESGICISLSEAYSMCESLLYTVSDDTYIPSNVRPFKLNSTTNQGMLWIIYRKTVDGVPIIADNDFKFYVSDNKVLHMTGSVYNLAPIDMDQRIISLKDAVSRLIDVSSRINVEDGYLYLDHIYNNEIPVSKITFEYIVLQSTDMSYVVTPIWRFHIGYSEEENMIFEDRIIAINALTGNLIAERRRHTY